MGEFQVFFSFKLPEYITKSDDDSRQGKDPKLPFHNARTVFFVVFIFLHVPENSSNRGHENPGKRKKRMKRAQGCKRQNFFEKIRHDVLKSSQNSRQDAKPEAEQANDDVIERIGFIFHAEWFSD